MFTYRDEPSATPIKQIEKATYELHVEYQFKELLEVDGTAAQNAHPGPPLYPGPSPLS